MKADIPAPGGALESSPKARTDTASMEVAVNSVKKLLRRRSRRDGGYVMKLLKVSPSARSAPPKLMMSVLKTPKAIKAARKAPSS